MSAALNQIFDPKEITNHHHHLTNHRSVELKLKRKDRHILIIDDDIDIARAIKCLAESYGENILCDIVCDPYEALIALSDKEFDLVLVDQKIPGLDGTQLLSKIDDYVDQDPLIVESGRYLRTIPTVLMSGSDIKLPSGFKLKHFNLEKIINKRDLSKFISETFTD